MSLSQAMPEASASEQPWRSRDGQVRLLAAKAGRKQSLHFPPLPPLSPLAASQEIVELGATAVLYSFTVIYPSPKSGKPPFALGYADFPEGVRVFGRIETRAGAKPRIGSRLRPVLIEIDGKAMYAFEEIEEEKPA